MELYEIKTFLLTERNHYKNKKATYQLGDDIFRQNFLQGLISKIYKDPIQQQKKSSN